MCRNADLEGARESGLIGPWRPDFTDFFAGKELTFHFDNGVNLTYRFKDLHTLSWSEDGVNFTEEFYDALPSTAEGVYFIHHIRHLSIPYPALSLIIDMDAELITWIDIQFGDELSDKNLRYQPIFGYFGEPKEARHSLTDEMAGLVIDWKYTPEFIIRHAYPTPWCVLSPGAPSEDENTYLFRKTLPAKFCKIRDNLYTVSFREDEGAEATLLIDLNSMHDVGAFYTLQATGKFESYTVGAVGAKAKFGFTGKYAIE